MYATASAETTARLPKPKRGKRDVSRFRLPGYAAAAAKAKPPQAVFKVISHARGYRSKVLLNYVARTGQENELPMEDEAGLRVAGRDEIEAVYQEWAEQFERAKPGQKRPPRHVTHTIFSADCAQTSANARAVQSAVAEVMREQFGANYRYLMVLHTDNKNPHVHVVINNYNQMPGGKKLVLDPPDLMAMRQQFAQKLRERGIEQHAHRRQDRTVLLEAISQGTEALRAAGSWYERKAFAALEAGRLGARENGDATPAMIKWAEELAEKNGVALEGHDFETVRKYLDAHSNKHIGLDAGAGGDAAEKPQAFDAFAKRREMERAVKKIEAEIKATTLPFTIERRDRMKLLQEVRDKLIDPAAPNYRSLVADLALKLERDRERVKDFIRALTDPAAAIHDRKQRRQREQAIDKILARNIEAVKAAREDLQRAPGLGVIEGHKLGAQLKSYERELRRIATLHSLGVGDLAAPGSVADVAAARNQAKVIERAGRTADKLAALGPWYEATPRPGQEAKTPRKAFDAFAKRRALTNIATHLADRLAAAGVPAEHPLAVRVAELQAAQIAAPAPDYAKLVDRLQLTLQDARLRADFEARRAAHAGTSAEARDKIRGEVRKALTKRADALRQARREIAEAPTLPDRERQVLGRRLKRAQVIVAQASRLAHKPQALAAKLAELDRLTPAPLEAKAPQRFDERSIDYVDYGRNPYDVAYGLRDTPAIPWAEPRAGEPSLGETAPTLDSLRDLSGGGLDADRADSALLVPDHARDGVLREGAEPAAGLRRPAPGAGAAARGAEEHAEAGAPLADVGGTPTERFAGLLDRLQTQLEAAGPWDDPTPYQSPFREGKLRSAPELDAFGKQRAMLADIDRLKTEIDGGRVDFTPAMRRQLAAIRDMREGIEKTPARDLEDVVSRLAQKVTDDQLRFMRQSDTPTNSVTELVQRKRQVARAADRTLTSVESARKAVEAQKNLTIAQRTAFARRLADMQRAMAMHAGRGHGMGM